MYKILYLLFVELVTSLNTFFKKRFISCMWVHCCCLQTHQKRVLNPHYRWLWATMWLLRIKLRTSGRAVSALNRWAISLALFLLLIPRPMTPQNRRRNESVGIYTFKFLHCNSPSPNSASTPCGMVLGRQKTVLYIILRYRAHSLRVYGEYILALWPRDSLSIPWNTQKSYGIPE